MLTLRNVTDADLDSADIILRAAFGTTRSRRKTMQQNLWLQPDGWILALLDDEPVGLVGAINYGPFAYVGSMSVLPIAQRRGVGKALLTELLGWLEQQRCPTVLLDATLSGAALYRHFAFSNEGSIAHWSRESTIRPTTTLNRNRPFHKLHVAFLCQEEIDALTSYDAQYFGAGRATVFTILLMDLPGRVLIARNVTGQITGYLFAGEHTLGPWVADSREDAEALLVHALTLPFVEGPIVLAPEENPHATALLEDYGFKRQRVLQHMRRGVAVELRQRSMIYGQASFALG